jgi:hypothetical protein
MGGSCTLQDVLWFLAGDAAVGAVPQMPRHKDVATLERVPGPGVLLLTGPGIEEAPPPSCTTRMVSAMARIRRASVEMWCSTAMERTAWKHPER